MFQPRVGDQSIDEMGIPLKRHLPLYTIWQVHGKVKQLPRYPQIISIKIYYRYIPASKELTYPLQDRLVSWMEKNDMLIHGIHWKSHTPQRTTPHKVGTLPVISIGL